MNENGTFSIDRPVCVGIIGGGQLGKMIAHEARRMSFKVIVLDPTPDCPASRIADDLIVADFKDANAIITLSEKCDVLTYEIELANSIALKELESVNYPIHPTPKILYIIQNKYRQKTFLKEHGIAVPDFALVRSKDHLVELCSKFGFPAMLKACEDSYDGRGNFLIRSKNQLSRAFNYFSDKECMLEKFVPFTKEISIMVSRNPSGQVETFPVAENIHKNNILDTTIVPARISQKVELKAKKMAQKTMKALQGSGIFGIEMFVTKDGDVLVNEIAPRPHNSGHYTNEACSVSQFEQHLRAILNLPLSAPELLSPAVMVNILGPEGKSGSYKIKGLDQLLEIRGLKLYIYGKKTTKPSRKLGHFTVTGRNVEQAITRAKKARKTIIVRVTESKE